MAAGLAGAAASPHAPILLTFDDGPHPEYTPAVLDRLARSGRRGVFFLVGQRIDRAAHLPSAIVAAGHGLGNHTFFHDRRGWLDFSAAADDVARCQALLPGATWFRPPFGRMTPGLRRAAHRHGLAPLHWSLDSGDWRCHSAQDAQTCAIEVLTLVKPGDVVLFHDDHTWIEAILDVVLPGLLNCSRLGPEKRAPLEASCDHGESWRSRRVRAV